MGIGRRRFLKTVVGVGASAAVALTTLPSLTSVGSGEADRSPKTRKVRRWVMAIDLEKCDGCKECTKACIKAHMVPPAWGEPNHDGRQEWIKVYDFKEDLGPHGSEGDFLPAPCMHCEEAPCIKVCPVGATYHNEDGVVLIDHNKCIGCRFCMAACPYERRYFNWGEPHTDGEGARLTLSDYSPEFPVPHRKGTVEKCMFCAHNIKYGKLPECLEACTKAGMKAIYFGDANEDAVTNGEEVLRLSELLRTRAGHRFKEELGTHPRVFYLPPRGA